MSRKPLTIGNQLQFLKIEEALKKNNASERLRIFLQRKMRERADIELKNIKLLQHWLDDLEDPRDGQALDGSDAYLLESQMIRTMVGTLKDDVNAFIGERQAAYNSIMANDGPHAVLQKPVVRTSDVTKTIYSIREEFDEMNEKRRRIETDYVKRMEYKEHTNNQISELEDKLAKRSRITSKRRAVSRNGHRNIDALNQRLSTLRQRVENENEKMETLKDEINDLESSTAQTLEAIDKELEQLETGRIKIIALQTKLYVQRLNGGRRITPQERVTGLPKFALFNVDHMEKAMKNHWSDVTPNAKRSQAGAQFRVSDFFCVEKSQHKDADGNAAETGTSIRNAASTQSTGKYGQVDLRKIYNKMLNQDMRAARSSPAVGTGTGNGTSPSAAGNGKQRRKVARHKEPAIVDSSSSSSGQHISVSSTSSVESLQLPPEIRCPADVTSVDPNRQFQNVFNKIKRPFSRNNSDHTPVVPYVCASVDSDMSSESLGRLTNIKVIATQAYSARRTGELTLKKGQIVKQKAAADDDGFCYGWTKDSRLSPKRYGHYPTFAVQFYKACKPKPQREPRRSM